MPDHQPQTKLDRAGRPCEIAGMLSYVSDGLQKARGYAPYDRALQIASVMREVMDRGIHTNSMLIAMEDTEDETARAAFAMITEYELGTERRLNNLFALVMAALEAAGVDGVAGELNG